MGREIDIFTIIVIDFNNLSQKLNLNKDKLNLSEIYMTLALTTAQDTIFPYVHVTLRKIDLIHQVSYISKN